MSGQRALKESLGVERVKKAEAGNRDPVLLVVCNLDGQRTAAGVVNTEQLPR